MLLRYDTKNLFEKKGGIKASALRSLLPKLQRAKEKVLRDGVNGTQGFLNLANERSHTEHCKRVLSELPETCTDLIVLGIGGSDLGGRMLLESIGTGKNLRVHFGGSTTDPDEVYRFLNSVDPKKTCVNIVSKSGGTIEPMTSFLIAREMLIQANGKKHFASRIIATTDPARGALFELGMKEGYHVLEIPENVGGRFSVLSSVGLFPLLADGGDGSKLLSGAKAAGKRFRESPVSSCDISTYAAAHFLLLLAGKQSHVLMPYLSRLGCFGRWYRQLFAESLGKRMDRTGREVFTGLTPIAALGPEDQHSQLQLYAEGPRDKVVTFIEADAFTHSALETPDAGFSLHPIRGYGKKRLTDVIHAERATTAESLMRHGCPNETIFIRSLDAESLGALIIFFEAAVALLGELLDIDAYDQPGVELSKKLMKERFSLE